MVNNNSKKKTKSKTNSQNKKRTCKIRKVKTNSDGTPNEEDMEYNRKCELKYIFIDNPWMKPLLKEKNPKGYNKDLKEMVKKKIKDLKTKTKSKSKVTKNTKSKSKSIDKKVQKGSGSWTSLCPICGIHFRVNFSEEKDFQESLDYTNKFIFGKKKKISKEDTEKYIESYHKLKKIEKHTFSNSDKITLLLPNSKVIQNVKYIDSNNFEKRNKDFGEVYFTENPLYDDKKYSTYGLPMHTECWNLAKKNYNHELKLDDFLFNKNILSPIKYLHRGYSTYLLKNINYGDILEYYGQDFYDFKLIQNEKHWYMYYLPSGKSEESKKNSKRISKILNTIIKGIKKPKEKKLKDRPSPSESATKFKVGTKKKGNDGNMYIISSDKNNVNRWKKI